MGSYYNVIINKLSIQGFAEIYLRDLNKTNRALVLSLAAKQLRKHWNLCFEDFCKETRNFVEKRTRKNI